MHNIISEHNNEILLLLTEYIVYSTYSIKYIAMFTSKLNKKSIISSLRSIHIIS